MAHALGRPARLLPVPVPLLRGVARAMGRTPQIERLIGSLQVNIGHTQEVLNWRPPLDVRQGLALAVQDVLK
jgi:hypothetical protein